jgi:hypothetical protein
MLTPDGYCCPWGTAASWLAAGALLACLSCGARCADPTPTRQKAEAFDHDPGWDGKNNRVAPTPLPLIVQDFGYSPTNHAGKAKGEIGGRVAQSLRPAYYAKVLEASTLDNPLSASGSVAVLQAQSVSGWHTSANLYVGWFNADERDLIWRPRNFVGFRLQSFNEPDGALVELTYGTRAWQAGGMFVDTAGGGQERKVRDLASSRLLRIPPDGSKHAWRFDYDPKAAGGAGQIAFTFDGASTRLALRPALRRAGATFNRFGPGLPRCHFLAASILAVAICSPC